MIRTAKPSRSLNVSVRKERVRYVMDLVRYIGPAENESASIHYENRVHTPRRNDGRRVTTSKLTSDLL